MYQIILEKAENGLIKTLIDDNANGNGTIQEQKLVYELKNDGDISTTIKIIMDLCQELNLPVGNVNTAAQLHHFVTWGQNYKPTVAEVKDRIAGVEKELARLQGSLPQEETLPKE